MSRAASKQKPGERLESSDRLRLWLRLLASTTTIEQAIRTRLRKEFDTTLPRFDVMAILARTENGLTMSELSRSLMVSNGNVTGLIDRMAEEGLVMRIPHPEDRRSSYVALSKKGRARFDEMAARHAGWIDEMFDGLDRNDADELTRILHILRDTATQGSSS
jgi:DNA-binding MarR family transcriptional regulator